MSCCSAAEACGPEMRTMATAARPGAVDSAKMVDGDAGAASGAMLATARRSWRNGRATRIMPAWRINVPNSTNTCERCCAARAPPPVTRLLL